VNSDRLLDVVGLAGILVGLVQSVRAIIRRRRGTASGIETLQRVAQSLGYTLMVLAMLSRQHQPDQRAVNVSLGVLSLVLLAVAMVAYYRNPRRDDEILKWPV